MSLAHQDFLNGEYSRASVGVEPIEPEREDPGWPVGKCLCCGERKQIPPMQHCCEECLTYEGE